MSDRRYTAQEMREMANKLDGENSEYAICHYDNQDNEWRPLWANPNSAVRALRQAADMVERCEKLRFNMIPHKHDTEIVSYILRGDAGKEKR